MAETELDRLERNVSSLVTSVTVMSKDITVLTKDVLIVTQGLSANREDISKLHEALKLVASDVEKHGVALYRFELEAAKEEGRKSAMGDLQMKLREHDDAAREVKTLRTTQTEQGTIVEQLKRNYDQQRGFLVAVSVIAPIVVSLLIAFISKALGLG